MNLYSALYLSPFFAICCPSVCHLYVHRLSICNVRAPYSGDWNFRQFFYAVGTLPIH